MSEKKYTVLLPEDLARINAVVADRSKINHVIGMLDGIAWGAPGPYGEAIESAKSLLEEAIMDGGRSD